jgi:uncharacterized protein
MKIRQNQILVSPTDLNNFTLCRYLIKNDISFEKDQKKLKKKKPEGDLELVRKLGAKHEKKHLKLFQEKDKPNITINNELSDSDRFRDTVAAIKKGYKMIHKAFFVDNKFRGEVDFLIRVETKSKLGAFSYEVYDTKIARNPRPVHVLQITAYSEMLGKIQGSAPKKMHLIDGSDNMHPFKVSEFIDYFLYTKKVFLDFLDNSKKETVYPEKCSHCKICHWLDECEKIWIGDNYINQVAGIKSSQIEKFREVNIDTVKDLAKINPDKIDLKINHKTLTNLKIKAGLVQEKRETGESKFNFVDTEDNKGFYKLPKPNPGDVFIDLEGYPYFETRGFEYLHGLYLNTGKKMEFKYFWARSLDRRDEKENFVKLIEYLKKHFDKNPDAFLYHYNEYEKSALRNLSNDFSPLYPGGLHFVDQLQRLKKFVDLYRVVEQCMLTSEKDISLKTIETFYKKERKANIKSAAESVVLYDQWLETQKESLKQDIINYNKDDCISTYELREFLLKGKPSDIPWFFVSKEEKEEHTEKKNWEKKEEKLINNLETKKNEKNKEFITNLQNIVGFYSREKKPEFWAIHDRLEKEHEDLVDDPDCIGNCIRTSDPPEKEKKSQLFKYKFQRQDYKLKEGDEGFDILGIESRESNGKSPTRFTIKKITEKKEEEYLTVKIGPKILDRIGSAPDLLTLGPGDPFDNWDQERAIDRYMNSILVKKPENKYKCLNDFLNNEFPDIENLKKGENLIDENKDIVQQAINVAKNLNSSFLVIQGPPGTGKTRISAILIIELLKQNKKVGISSNSHKAINNLLSQIEEIAIAEKFTFKGVKKNRLDRETKLPNEDQVFKGKTEMIDNITGYSSLPGDYFLFAGTSWMFSYTGSKKDDERPPLFADQSLDYMFIDEAGQVSLSNTISLGVAAKNLILIGDQMQLSQPIKGTHAGNSGRSSLEFLLMDQDTIPPNRGIFLKETWRLNEKICQFISDTFYESRLKPNETAKKRKVTLRIKDFKAEGIFYIPVDHRGRSTSSDEEVDLIKSAYKQILGSKYEDEKRKGALDHKNIMTIAPFNVQVVRLMRELPKNARVGTIDKFQGQQSKVVFISMTSSDPENLPRHKDFFFSRNRLNVAISRAESTAIIIFNPNLLLTSCKNIHEMRLLNNFCKLIKYKSRITK